MYVVNYPNGQLQPGLQGSEEPASLPLVGGVCAFPQPSAAAVDVAKHYSTVREGWGAVFLSPPLARLCLPAREAGGLWNNLE